MEQALSLDDNRIIRPEPGVEAICPLCREPVVAKCGDIMVWHFAHLSRDECDPWYEGETPWHHDWKYSVSPPQREVPLCVRADLLDHDDDTLYRHRADIIAGDGTIVELQNSPIGVEDIIDRELFYKRMRWVFNVRDVRRNIRIQKYPSDDDGRRNFVWRNPRKHIAETTHTDGTNVITYLDLGHDWDLGYDVLFRIGKFDADRDFVGNNGYGWYVPRKDFVDWLNRPLTLRTTPDDNVEDIAHLEDILTLGTTA